MHEVIIEVSVEGGCGVNLGDDSFSRKAPARVEE